MVHGFSCPTACGIFHIRDRTKVPCIARQILNHWTAREAPQYYFFLSCLFSYLDLYLISVLMYIMICNKILWNRCASQVVLVVKNLLASAGDM